MEGKKQIIIKNYCLIEICGQRRISSGSYLSNKKDGHKDCTVRNGEKTK